MRGVFLDIETVGPGDLDLKPLVSTLPEWSLLKSTRPDDVRQVIRNTDVVVTNKVRLESDALQYASQLKLVCVAATGTDNPGTAAPAPGAGLVDQSFYRPTCRTVVFLDAFAAGHAALATGLHHAA